MTGKTKIMKLMQQGRTRVITIGSFLSEEMFTKKFVKVTLINKGKNFITLKFVFRDRDNE